MQQAILEESTYESISSELRIFFGSIKTKHALAAMVSELEQGMPDYQTWFETTSAKGEGIRWPNTEVERARLCLSILHHYADTNDIMELPRKMPVVLRISDQDYNLTLTTFLTRIFRPLVRFMISQLEDKSIVLYLLQRFKAKVEWFERETLYEHFKAARGTGNPEKVLDRRLREYLFDNGIDYPFSQPSSASGLADVVAELDSADPLVLEVKIFDGARYESKYVRKGLKQVLRYAEDYNKTTGYLLVYNTSNKRIRFDLNGTDPPRIEVDGRVVFIIVIELCERQSASTDTREVVSIKEEFLLEKDES